MIMLAEKQYEPVPGLPDFVLPAYYAIKAAEAAIKEQPDHDAAFARLERDLEG